MPKFQVMAIALAVSLSAAAMPDADAEIQTIASSSTAVDSCQASLPAFESLLRKRPLAVQNEGAKSAFVSCARAADANASASEVFFINNDVQQHTINCTAVIGGVGFEQYLTRSVEVPAGRANAITLTSVDQGGDTTFGTNLISWSCQLPPGTGVSEVAMFWLQDVGN